METKGEHVIRTYETPQAFKMAIERTFQHRATHEIPQALPDPAAGWKPVYERIARADDLPWKTIEDLVDAVRRFIDPLLSGTSGMWNPQKWEWES